MSTQQQDDLSMEVDTEHLESDTNLPIPPVDTHDQEDYMDGEELEESRENADAEQETVTNLDTLEADSKSTLKNKDDWNEISDEEKEIVTKLDTPDDNTQIKIRDNSDLLEQVLQDRVVQRFTDALSLESLQSFVGEEELDQRLEFQDESELTGGIFVSKKCTLSSDYVDVEYSFSYDCYKNFNICCPDPNYLVFLSGCFIHILDLSTKLVGLRRGSGGQGLGCITKNHMEPHIAIGEKGHSPSIVIYEWPSFQVVSVLKGGSVKQYTCLDYNPAGDILVSQSGEPDHLISIWNWKQRHVILKVKSHAQDVYNVRFSKYVTGHLCSSGLGHIKMWKMVNTFTSLKLLGTIGRFGKTTTCDILAVYPMPDEKVLSGCEWGNILVWDDGLIKFEVMRKNHRPCHDQQIVQFLYDPGALQITTVGADGFIRVWNYQTIDLANPPEDEKFVEIEPILEIQVKEGIFEAQLMHIVECPGTEDNTWFGQDRRGGLWRLNVEVSTNIRPAEKLYVTHAGAVIDMSASPRGLYLATVGSQGRLAVWSVEDKRVVLFHDSAPFKFVSILWLPTKAYKSGCAMVVGLACGLVKVLIIRLKEKLSDPDGNIMDFDTTNEDKWLHPIQVLKPHRATVSCLITNPRATFVISGSQDKTIFIFAIKHLLDKNLVHLEPIGFVDTLGGVSHLCWPMEQRNSLFVSCSNGYSMQIHIPPDLPSRSGLSSYRIPKLKIKVARFRSVKSKLTRAAYMEKVQALKDAKLKRKKQEAEEMKRKNPALEFDEYYFYDSQEEIYLKDLPEEYIPPEPSPILFTIPMGSVTSHHSPGTDLVWVSVDGYDAGYLYGVTMTEATMYEEEEEERAQEIIHLPHMTDIPVTCYIKDSTKNHLYLGFGDGILRLIQIDPQSPSDLSRYIQLATHDRQYGRIRRLCMSVDQTRLYSCGEDGNVFSYLIRDPTHDVEPTTLEFSNVKIKDLDIRLPEEIGNSLEEEKQNIRKGDRLVQVEQNKRNLLSTLNNLQQQLSLILKRLDDIPEPLKPSDKEFELDPRISAASRKMAKEPLDLIKTKMRYKIEKSKFGYEKLYNYFLQNVDCFYKHVFDTRCERYVTTFTLSKMKPDYDEEFEHLVLKTAPHTHVSFNLPYEKKEPRTQSKEEIKESSDINLKKPSFLKDLESFKHKLPLRTQRALKKYYENREEIRSQRPSFEEYEKGKIELEASLDCGNVVDPAPGTVIGNYTMKSDPQYRVPKDKRTSHTTKSLQILKTQKEIYQLKKNFNDKVEALLQEKFDLVLKMKQLQHDMKQAQNFIPKKFHHTFPSIPCLNFDLEFPEKKFQIDEENMLDQFEPQNTWKCSELDLLKIPHSLGPVFSENFSHVDPNAMPEIISHTVATKRNEVSQTLFKLDNIDEKSLEPLALPPSPSSQLPRDVLSHSTLPENEPVDFYGPNMFFSTPDTLIQSKSLELSTLKLSELSTSSFDMSTTEMEEMFKLDQQESPLEKEMRKDIILRLILQQASIANDVAKSKEIFDNKVKNLSLERFNVAESVKLLDLFQLTLQEEAIVLDKFKDGENAIQVVIDEEAANIQEKLAKIAEMEKKIRCNDEKILQLKEKIKSVESSFAKFNRNSPKYALLYYKKVFQKKLKIRKMKAPKEGRPTKSSINESRSSSKKYSKDRDDRSDYTTSSEEEEDLEDENDVEAEDKDDGEAGDKDDEGMWDEHQPPPGLNPKTLETVVQLRLQRHEVEEEIAAINTKTDNLVKEIALVTNSIKYLRSVMEKRNEELDGIITEKQKNLNQVDTTVVLKVSQVKNEDFPLSECIVLPSSQLAWLNNRSYELKKQTDAERKQFHDFDKALSKIKNENNRLQEQYKTLLGQVNEATVKKYGRLVNVANLEEAVLQALIHEVRMDVSDIVKSLDADLKQKEMKLEEEKCDLLKMIKDEGESFRFFVTMKEEKTQLQKEIAIINSKKKLDAEKHKQSQCNYEEDIAKLSTIYDTMQHEEVLIMRELCDLTHKSIRHPVKLPPMKKMVKGKNKPKDIALDRQTELKNATRKIKEILESIDDQSTDIVGYNHLVDDLQELYGLNIKGTDSNETVDDVVDVLVDLTTKQEESNIGVSNAEVIKATLSMLLLDIEQNEGQLQKTHENEDNKSVQSEGSVVEEVNADIIKVSLKPDEGEGMDQVIATDELPDDRNVKSEDASERDTEKNRGEMEIVTDLEESSANRDENEDINMND